MAEGFSERVRQSLRRFRRWRKGIPAIAGPSHEALRGAHEEKTLLVLGNGPTVKSGLAYGSERWGSELITVGMNGCGLLTAPNYYVFSDSFALMLFAHLVDPAHSRAIIQPSALGKASHAMRREKPDMVDHIRKLAGHPSTLRLDRDKLAYTQRLDLKLQRLAGPGSGPAALQLALLMLLPRLNGQDEFEHRPRPGRLVVAGMDGYEADKAWHFYSGGADAAAVFEAESRNNPQKIQDALGHNLFQSAIMIQVISLARLYGIEVVNLSHRGVLEVNELCRDSDFDNRQDAEAQRAHQP